MSEYLHVNQSPSGDATADGLYNWMRVLAGGGVSQFSGIQMRGPLIDQNGGLVVAQGSLSRMVWSFEGNNTAEILGAGDSHIVSFPTSTGSAFSSTGGLARLNSIDFTCINNSGTGIDYICRVVISVEIVNVAPTLFEVYIVKNNGFPSGKGRAQVTVAPGTSTITIPVQIQEGFTNGEKFEVFYKTSAAATVTVKDGSLDVERLY